MSRRVKSSAHTDEMVAGVTKILSDKAHKYDDAELIVDGKSFPVNKTILAMKLQYFDEEFFPPISSLPAAATASVHGPRQHIPLNEIRANDFHRVLEFVYTGETTLNDENVVNIMKAAETLKMTELRNFCIDYLLETVITNNSPRYWRLAEETADKCKKFCMKEFENMSSSDNLESLSEDMMRELLESDDLVAASEADVCKILVSWMESQEQRGNAVQPYRFLTCIRWSEVPVEYVQQGLVTNAILKRDRRATEFLQNVVAYRLHGIQFSELNTFHRSSRGTEKCIVVVGNDPNDDDESMITEEVLCVSLQRQSCTTSTAISRLPTKIQFDSAACVFGETMYVTGVGDGRNETWKWEQEGGWTRCADMNEGRRRHCMALVKKCLYVLGGLDDLGDRPTTLDSIEMYDTEKDTWRRVGRLKQPTCCSTCVVYKQSIYVFGGRVQESRPKRSLDSIQEFDRTTNQCYLLEETIPANQQFGRSVRWENYAIIIAKRGCLVCNLEERTFDSRPQFASEVNNFGLVLENQRLFVFGGNDKERHRYSPPTRPVRDEVKSVPVMDIINNEPANWTHHATLPQPAVRRLRFRRHVPAYGMDGQFMNGQRNNIRLRRSLTRDKQLR